jgi:hypothetical protein
MPDPALYVARLGTPLVAEAVLVRNGTFADIGDDFHVGVGMRRKAGIGCDFIIVPYPQRAPAHAGRVRELAEGKVVLGLEPAMVAAGELVEWSAFDHRDAPWCRFRTQTYGQSHALKIESIETNRFGV